MEAYVLMYLIGSRMKLQLYTNDFDTFQSNAYFGVEESPFFKNMCDSPNKPPLRFQEGFQLFGIHQIYTLLDHPFSIQD